MRVLERCVPLPRYTDVPRWTIYLLLDPDDPNLGYVGQTRRKLATRIRQHVNECKRTNMRRSRWLRTVVARGLSPIAETLEVCESHGSANSAEIAWIKRCERERGMVLMNTAPGGYFVFDEEGRKAALRRSLAHPESKKRKSAASKAMWETRSKEAWLASFKPECRERQGEKMKAKWADPHWRAATIAKQRASLAHPEERARKSAATRAARANPEVRKQSAAKVRAFWNDPTNADRIAERNAKISRALRKWSDPCGCGRPVHGLGRCQRCLKFFHRTGREHPLNCGGL